MIMSILKKDFKFIDLFAGIGGFHFAMQKYSKDAECILASEINKNAIKLYKLNFDLDSDNDVTTIKGDEFEAFDVLCAGFPCQSFSKAGNQKGFDDSRGILFNEIERIIKEKIEINQKPKILILENVKSLVNHDDKKTWKTIKEKLFNIGYNVVKDPYILSPHQFNIPQRRERAIILAVDKNIYDGDINLTFNFNEVEPNIEDILEQLSHDQLKEYSISNRELKVLEAWDHFIKNLDRKVLGFPIWSDEFYNKRDISDLPDWKQVFIRKNWELYSSNKTMIDSWYKKYKVYEFNPTQRKFEWQAGNDIEGVFDGLIQFRPSGVRVKRPTLTPTLVAMKHIPIIGKEKRYLTREEAAKLQSLPDDFDFDSVGNDIYRLLGNAVNVRVIYEAFKTFIEYIDRRLNQNENI